MVGTELGAGVSNATEKFANVDEGNSKGNYRKNSVPRPLL